MITDIKCYWNITIMIFNHNLLAAHLFYIHSEINAFCLPNEMIT